MPRRRRLLTFAAAVALFLAASYIYWAWDPVDVTRYVPRDSIIILETEDLMDGFNDIGYGEIAGLLPEPVRREVLLPYRSLGPWINAMDIIGTRCVIFVPARAAGTMPRGAVMVARISRKAKLAETLVSLVGRTHKVSSPAGRNVRMVQPEGFDDPLFYARVDRTLIVSDSVDSVDAALGTPSPELPAVRRDYPVVTLKIKKEGFTAILELLKSLQEYERAPFIRNLADQINNMMEMEINVSLIEDPEFVGHLALYAGGVFEDMYRADYKTYRPKGFDVVPGRISAAFSTNDPGIAEELEIATVGVNRLFHVTNDFFDDMESFGGELTLAATRIGEEAAEFLFVSTRNIFFPRDTINALLHRLRTKFGETNYVGREKGGDVYRIRSTRLDVPAYLWIARNTILLCASENAFRAFVSKPSTGTGSGPTFKEGDLFLVADPAADPEVFLRILPVRGTPYHPLLDIIGPVRFQATSIGGKIRFSGNITMRHDEGS